MFHTPLNYSCAALGATIVMLAQPASAQICETDNTCHREGTHVSNSFSGDAVAFPVGIPLWGGINLLAFCRADHNEIMFAEAAADQNGNPILLNSQMQLMQDVSICMGGGDDVVLPFVAPHYCGSTLAYPVSTNGYRFSVSGQGGNDALVPTSDTAGTGQRLCGGKGSDSVLSHWNDIGFKGLYGSVIRLYGGQDADGVFSEASSGVRGYGNEGPDWMEGPWCNGGRHTDTCNCNTERSCERN